LDLSSDRILDDDDDDVNSYFLHKICHNSDMFRSVLIIFRELFNNINAYIK